MPQIPIIAIVRRNAPTAPATTNAVGALSASAIKATRAPAITAATTPTIPGSVCTPWASCPMPRVGVLSYPSVVETPMKSSCFVVTK